MKKVEKNARYAISAVAAERQKETELEQELKTKIFDQDMDIGQCHLDEAKTCIHAKVTNIDVISDSFSEGLRKGYSWSRPLTIQNVEFVFEIDKM